MSESINIYEFSKRTTEEVFPYITIVSPNNTVPLIVSVVEPGDIPLVIELNGTKKVVARMSASAFNVDKLMRTCGSLEYHVDKDNVILLQDITDYMEVFEWTY